MKLSQSRVVPLALFTAITAAVMAILLLQGQLVFGHEDPEGCDVNISSLGISTLDAAGADVADVYHGMEVSYQAVLSIAEVPQGRTACNFGGGTLSITTPDGQTQEVAGGETGIEIPLVQTGSVYEAPAVAYKVDQTHAENGALTVTAAYKDGVSHTSAGEDAASAGPVGKTIQLQAPSISIEVTPDTQTQYEGGNAEFRITVQNTGGFELSDVQVGDSLDTDCGRNIGTLGVGDPYTIDCTMSPAQAGQNNVTVTAQVVGGVPEGQETVSATATASIEIEALSITVELTPASQNVRDGDAASFVITVTNPNTADIVEASLSVPEVPNCDHTIGAMEPGAAQTYECSNTFAPGITMVTATATGTVSVVGKVVTASATAEVDVFEADLGINIAASQDTIRSGDSVELNVTVTNHGGAPLTEVMVTAGGSAAGCSKSLGTMTAGQEIVYSCTSAALTENTEITVDVTGTAPDGGPVTNSGMVSIRVIHPNSAVDVSEVESMSFRVVVHVLTITETNTGDSPLTDVYVDVEPVGVRLTKDSAKHFIGGDTGDDGVLGPGETWEWRLVTVSLQGPGVVLDDDAQAAQFTATGHGTDPLGGDITHPAFAAELDTLEVPIS